jgi:pimeloyl-ACP methyl ester carboxylesterase
MIPSNDRTLQALDGTRIAYGVQGDGPAVLLTNGLTTTTTFWQALVPRLLPQYRVLTWDLPGHGASGPARDAGSVTPGALCDVMERVMDAAGVRHAVQLGWSTGCQLVLELYRRRPACCVALGALLGPAQHALSTTRLPLGGDTIAQLLRHTPDAVLGPLFGAIGWLANAPGSAFVAQRFGLTGRELPQEQLREITAHLRQVDPRSVRALALALQAHSAWEVLATLEAPFLIVAGDTDPFAPSQDVGLPMHAAAPGSELLRLPTGTHTAMLDHAGPIGDAVVNFVRRHAR